MVRCKKQPVEFTQYNEVTICTVFVWVGITTCLSIGYLNVRTMLCYKKQNKVKSS